MYCGRYSYPLNFFFMALFTLSEAVFVATLDYAFYSHIPYQAVGYFFLWTLAMAYFSSRPLEKPAWATQGQGQGDVGGPHGHDNAAEQYRDDVEPACNDGDNWRKLPRISQAAARAWLTMLVVAAILNASMRIGEWGHFVSAQFGAGMLLAWVSWDANKLMKKVPVDQYLLALVCFYADAALCAFLCMFICMLGGDSDGGGSGHEVEAGNAVAAQ